MTESKMRFRLEQVYLTRNDGSVIPAGSSVAFHVIEATTVEEALTSFIVRDGAELIGDPLKLPGFQAIATARRDATVYTLQLHPATDNIRLH